MALPEPQFPQLAIDDANKEIENLVAYVTEIDALQRASPKEVATLDSVIDGGNTGRMPPPPISYIILCCVHSEFLTMVESFGSLDKTNRVRIRYTAPNEFQKYPTFKRTMTDEQIRLTSINAAAEYVRSYLFDQQTDPAKRKNAAVDLFARREDSKHPASPARGLYGMKGNKRLLMSDTHLAMWYGVSPRFNSLSGLANYVGRFLGHDGRSILSNYDRKRENGIKDRRELRFCPLRANGQMPSAHGATLSLYRKYARMAQNNANKRDASSIDYDRNGDYARGNLLMEDFYHDGTVGAIGTGCLSVTLLIIQELASRGKDAMVMLSPYAAWRRHMPIGLRGAYEPRHLFRPGRLYLKPLMRAVSGAPVMPSEANAWENFIKRGYFDASADTSGVGGMVNPDTDLMRAVSITDSAPVGAVDARAYNDTLQGYYKDHTKLLEDLTRFQGIGAGEPQPVFVPEENLEGGKHTIYLPERWERPWGVQGDGAPARLTFAGTKDDLAIYGSELIRYRAVDWRPASILSMKELEDAQDVNRSLVNAMRELKNDTVSELADTFVVPFSGDARVTLASIHALLQKHTYSDRATFLGGARTEAVREVRRLYSWGYIENLRKFVAYGGGDSRDRGENVGELSRILDKVNSSVGIMEAMMARLDHAFVTHRWSFLHSCHARMSKLSLQFASAELQAAVVANSQKFVANGRAVIRRDDPRSAGAYALSSGDVGSMLAWTPAAMDILNAQSDMYDAYTVYEFMPSMYVIPNHIYPREQYNHLLTEKDNCAGVNSNCAIFARKFYEWYEGLDPALAKYDLRATSSLKELQRDDAAHVATVAKVAATTTRFIITHQYEYVSTYVATQGFERAENKHIRDSISDSVFGLRRGHVSLDGFRRNMKRATEDAFLHFSTEFLAFLSEHDNYVGEGSRSDTVVFQKSLPPREGSKEEKSNGYSLSNMGWNGQFLFLREPRAPENLRRFDRTRPFAAIANIQEGDYYRHFYRIVFVERSKTPSLFVITPGGTNDFVTEKSFTSRARIQEALARSGYSGEAVIGVMRDGTVAIPLFPEDFQRILREEMQRMDAPAMRKGTWLNNMQLFAFVKALARAYDPSGTVVLSLGVQSPADPSTRTDEAGQYTRIRKRFTDTRYSQTWSRAMLVLNTVPETQKGPGLHWVGVFVERATATRPGSIEFYDSMDPGEPAAMVGTVGEIWGRFKLWREEGLFGPAENVRVKVNRTKHQSGGSECGMFVLRYLVERMRGVSQEAATAPGAVNDATCGILRAVYFDM